MTPQSITTSLKVSKQFIVTEREQVVNITPLTSFAIAHLSYGVPRKFNKVYRDITNHNLVFYKSNNLLKGEIKV